MKPDMNVMVEFQYTEVSTNMYIYIKRITQNKQTQLINQRS